MFRTFAFSALVLAMFAAPGVGHAMTLHVNCDQPMTKLSTINAALKLIHGQLEDIGPSTIEVSGACRENISVKAVSDLTLIAKNGASITDASGGTAPVITVERSANVALNGFAIRGGGGPVNAAVLCNWNSTCYLSSNNVQNFSGSAVVAWLGSTVALDHDVLEQSDTGLRLLTASRAEVVSATIRNNVTGVFAAASSVYTDNGTTIANNSGNGLFVFNQSSASVGNDTITGNGTAALVMVQSNIFFVFSTTVSGNGGGISIGDLSWANILPNTAVISGSVQQPDINCWGHFSGASGAAQAGSTNCPL